MKTRPVARTQRSKPTMEGAGVRLRRAFGHAETDILDPFLMLDHFRSSDPEDYSAGFPSHPHRGIETVTYMLSGEVEHEDSLGNKGVISGGDVQWMTAGSGIMHQEMPRAADGELHGFQLWVNLPRRSKMITPRYRDIKGAEIPIARTDGSELRVIAGRAGGVQGPVRDLVVPIAFLEARLGPGARARLPAEEGLTAFAYIFQGEASFHEGVWLGPDALVVFGDGDSVDARAGGQGCRFLFGAGPPLNEPIAWGGPVVMNTSREVEQAFEEMRAGTFIKERPR